MNQQEIRKNKISANFSKKIIIINSHKQMTKKTKSINKAEKLKKIRKKKIKELIKIKAN